MTHSDSQRLCNDPRRAHLGVHGDVPLSFHVSLPGSGPGYASQLPRIIDVHILTVRPATQAVAKEAKHAGPGPPFPLPLMPDGLSETQTREYIWKV
ncbi:hypothetical protein H6P81_005170 [Aristolochia fimbriata]|uniref:Uncharacterized protein n=1 Tax=Aristolochia fimbriata TaxID=158543 RepID=A0AAV7EX86_ARIFI|nr:hypothetical protein H6P81_005170 [Aristolochia fimbriata]